MVTITDVSRLANVSKATVSRVMSGSRGVKEASREAVLKAAEELNYRPNAAAQNLANQRTDYIGVILSTTDAGQVSTYLPLLSKALRSKGKHMLVNFADTPAEYQRVVEELNSGHCDAIIALGGQVPSSSKENVIAIDSKASSEMRNIGYDYRFASESACRFLFSKGHTSVAIVLDDDNYASQQVLEGYKTSLQNMAMPVNRQLIVNAGESTEQAMMTLLNSYSPFTAIIVMRDSQAAVAMKLLKDFNLSTPQEVSIMSLEDSSLAAQLTPPLTCISYPSEKLVEAAMKELDDYLCGRPGKDNSLVPGNLVTRESVVNR
ncbi:LacI family DNA-binding transcriptional regulator [Vibrio hannami]|uniref:LacI family DNA-binding transcriptional regulator n=1 Tax=Vibrio hannami TaxID=2717094 RepID=UPI0024106E8B|nr:LacI family DNA-binding transcriptional regulator [Vibrio hannami]MDG3086043.1 LacI family DNA-binding transcriptional regulator [Vibrio hannami]